MPRVIAGEKKGRRLFAPEGNQTRPTSDKVKEALFSIIQFEIIDGKFLDLFAGSGQMGIEALSRGAEKAVFVETSRQALECVKKNLEHTGYEDKAEAIYSDAALFLSSCREKFDVIFIDPPYKNDFIEQIIEKATEICCEDGAIICEIPCGEQITEEINGFYLKRRYRYGKTELALFRKQNAETEIY